MELILLQDVPHLGQSGQKITAKDGYAHNFLIPKGLAAPATAGLQRQAQTQAMNRLRTLEQSREQAETMGQKLEALQLTLEVAVGASGKLHGSVTGADLSRALADQGVTLDKHQILLERPITQVGQTRVPVKLHREVSAHLNVSVVPQSDANR